MTTGRRVVSARSLVAQSDLPRHEASRLLEAATGRDRSSLATDDVVEAGAAVRFAQFVQRRQRGEPLQYLEGSVPFGPIEVAVDSRVLIPRPETEEMWAVVVERLQDRPPTLVVDVGTGSGNLALALKHAFPSAEVHAIELSREAHALAGRNFEASGLAVQLHLGDLFAPLPDRLRHRVDLIISNPPYVPTTDFAQLPSDVRDHEPAVALFAGPDGLATLRRLIAAAPRWLAPGGLLACEIGIDQGAATSGLVDWGRAEIVSDLSGRERFLLVEKGGK